MMDVYRFHQTLQTPIQPGEPDMASLYRPTDSPSCPIARAIERPITPKSAIIIGLLHALVSDDVIDQCADIR